MGRIFAYQYANFRVQTPKEVWCKISLICGEHGTLPKPISDLTSPFQHLDKDAYSCPAQPNGHPTLARNSLTNRRSWEMTIFLYKSWSLLYKNKSTMTKNSKKGSLTCREYDTLPIQVLLLMILHVRVDTGIWSLFKQRGMAKFLLYLFH